MMPNSHQTWLRMAIDLSVQNVENGGGPFGAVIVKNNELIATGVNRVTATNDPTAHAEMVAIRAACAALGSFQLTDCELYTSCEPCPMCLGAIYWARPSRVYFANTKDDAAAIGFDDAFIYKELELAYEKRSIPFIQEMRTEGLAAFEAWKAKLAKTAY